MDDSGPIAGLGDMPVLDRIDVNVIYVMRQIFLVPDQMFPEAPLPDATRLSGCVNY